MLETERRLRAAEEALLSTKAEIWNARIDLHLALGGDWGATPSEDGRPKPARDAGAPTVAGAPPATEPLPPSSSPASAGVPAAEVSS